MALPLWGQLEKSTDDDTTIEEAIEEAIAAHNEESDAHLGSQQSLESHKTTETIDHPAGSVLADKSTDRELDVSTIFESLDNWDTSGTQTQSDIPGVSLYIEDGAVDASTIYSTTTVPANIVDSDFDLLFDLFGRFDLSSQNYVGAFGFFQAFGFETDGIGFEIDNGDLYGVWRGMFDEEVTGTLSVDLSQDHLYRVRYDSDLGVIYFEVDGQQVGSLDVSAYDFEMPVGPLMTVKTDGAVDGNFRIGNIHFSRALV